MEGISDKTIVKFFPDKTSNDVKKFFWGGFSFYVIRFISFHSMMVEFGAHYPFIIMKNDQDDKNSAHWSSFLDLHPKNEIFLFDSFEFKGFKEFILQDDQKVLSKILYDIEKFNKRDNKITLIFLKFFMQEHEKIKNKIRLSETTIDLLHLMNDYGKKQS